MKARMYTTLGILAVGGTSVALGAPLKFFRMRYNF